MNYLITAGISAGVYILGRLTEWGVPAAGSAVRKRRAKKTLEAQAAAQAELDAKAKSGKAAPAAPAVPAP